MKEEIKPTPWREEKFWGIVDADGEEICSYTTDDGIHFVGDAKKKIIQAVNSYESNKKKIEMLLDAVRDQCAFMMTLHEDAGLDSDKKQAEFLSKLIQRCEEK